MVIWRGLIALIIKLQEDLNLHETARMLSTFFFVFSVGMLYGSAEAFTLFDFNYVIDHFSARDCGDANATVRFNHFNVTPHPVIVPGTIEVALDLEIVRDISQTIAAEITVARRFDFGWFGHTWFDITPSCPDGNICRVDLCNFIDNVVDYRGCPSEIIDNGFTCTCPPMPGSYSSREDVPFVIEIRDRDLPSSFLRNLIKGSYKLGFSIYDGDGARMGCFEAEFGLIHRTQEA